MTAITTRHRLNTLFNLCYKHFLRSLENRFSQNLEGFEGRISVSYINLIQVSAFFKGRETRTIKVLFGGL